MRIDSLSPRLNVSDSSKGPNAKQSIILAITLYVYLIASLVFESWFVNRCCIMFLIESKSNVFRFLLSGPLVKRVNFLPSNTLDNTLPSLDSNADSDSNLVSIEKCF